MKEYLVTINVVIEAEDFADAKSITLGEIWARKRQEAEDKVPPQDQTVQMSVCPLVEKMLKVPQTEINPE